MASAPASSLYSRDILRLASALPHGDSIADPDGTATRRSPVCGSEISVELRRDEAGRITDIAFRARACALGQASAAFLRQAAIGRSVAEIAEARVALAAALSGDADFEAYWPELSAFAPARDHPGRHAAILLPYDAILAAAEAD
jgi:NifU-like protein involved in Fe-S cluster formation